MPLESLNVTPVRPSAMGLEGVVEPGDDRKEGVAAADLENPADEPRIGDDDREAPLGELGLVPGIDQQPEPRGVDEVEAGKVQDQRLRFLVAPFRDRLREYLSVGAIQLPSRWYDEPAA